jgi:hypothetical protein
MTTRTIAALTAAAAALGSLMTTSIAAPPAAPLAGPPSENPDPKLFKNPQDNPFFPLTPGLVTRLRGTDEGERFKQQVRVTAQTRVVAGVTTTVVRDVVRRADGSLAEKTFDWYAADQDGNVWYFGEATATYDGDGVIEDREGSWEAGVDGAVAGIIMPADPRPSQAAYMEYAKGEAEDQAWVVQRLASVRTPGGTYRHVVRTLEWSRLEPRVVSQKLYARGVGIVMERDVVGGDERFWLVSGPGA